MKDGKARQADPLARLAEELKGPLNRWELVLEGLALAGLLAAVAIVVVYWPALPDRVPIHFGLSGPPDASGDRGILWFLLFLIIVLYFALTGVFHMPPEAFNVPVPLTLENAPRLAMSLRFMIRSTKVLFMGMFAHLTWTTIAVARGRAAGLSPWFNLWWVSMLVLVAGSCWYIVRRERHEQGRGR